MKRGISPLTRARTRLGHDATGGNTGDQVSTESCRHKPMLSSTTQPRVVESYDTYIPTMRLANHLVPGISKIRFSRDSFSGHDGRDGQ